MTYRFHPYSELARLQREMNDLFGSRLAGAADETELEHGWRPEVDVFEDEQAFVLFAELPGVEPADVDVKLEDNRLSIRGERRMPFEDRQESYHRIERTYGKFARTFSLPNTVQPDKVEAAFKSGVLRITIPKREETKPRQISINVQE